MDLQSNFQPESGKLEQIIWQFLLKSLHIILDSRAPSLYPRDKSGDLSTGSHVKKSDKWFNLALGDQPAALDNLNFWHRNLMDPMIVDIMLVREGTGSSIKTVIERWVVQYEGPRVMAPQTSEYYKKAYQKSIVLFRSLYFQMRLLPVYRIFRQLSTSSHTCNFDIIYKVSSFSDPFSRAEEDMMEVYNFTPVEAPPGNLCISVTYCTTLADFNLEFSSPLPPKIITDYIGSPNTHPLKFFPASEKGVRDTSFPLKGKHPHSWTSGFHKASPFVQNQPIFGSPPIYRPSCIPCKFRSPPTDSYGKAHIYPILTQQRSTCYDEYQLSPPFSSSFSTSPSPSPPTGFFSGNRMQTRLCSETAPVTIPLSGRFSGLSSCGSPRIGFSRSSSRLSFQDDFDDGDFSYPFDVDDVDTPDVHPRSQNGDDKSASEITSTFLPLGRKSQDAAVGVLVHMLRTAPPLRQDPSCYSSHSLKTEIDRVVTTASGVFVLRKTADALEELRSYKEMRDLLLSKSDIGFMSKYEA